MNTFQSYGASLAIWDLTVLPASLHRWTGPVFTPTKQAGTRFTYAGGMKGWVGMGGVFKYQDCIPANGHPSQYQPGSTQSNFVDATKDVTIKPNCHQH